MKREEIYEEMDKMCEKLREYAKSPFISHEEQDAIQEALSEVSHSSTFIYCTLVREMMKED